MIPRREGLVSLCGETQPNVSRSKIVSTCNLQTIDLIDGVQCILVFQMKMVVERNGAVLADRAGLVNTDFGDWRNGGIASATQQKRWWSVKIQPFHFEKAFSPLCQANDHPS
jgi:hypothetical protein